MIFSDSPQQRALERMMTAVPRFRPKGGGIMVLHHFEYTAEMCDCRYCLYYCRKCTADDEGFSSPVDGRFLKSYAWAVEEALKADTADDEMDMAEFFDEDDGVKAKLVSAKWGVETYRGRLFGRIECSLKEELTDAETEILTDWISGQNSDGYGEHFEQQPIDTEDGDLYVSFWNNGDNYSIMTRDELDEYIDNQGMTMGGM